MEERAKERIEEKRRQLEERAKMLKEKMVSGNSKRNEQRSPSPPAAPKKMPRRLESKQAVITKELSGIAKESASSSASNQEAAATTTDETAPTKQYGSTYEARAAHYWLGHYGMDDGHRIMYYNKDGSFSRSEDEDMDSARR